MAKADHIKKLVASYGRSAEFRAAALRIIEDATNQGKKPFAESLRKILDANVQAGYQTNVTGLTGLAAHVDPATELIDELDVTRGLQDIVLNPDTRTLIEGIIEEEASPWRRASTPSPSVDLPLVVLWSARLP